MINYRENHQGVGDENIIVRIVGQIAIARQAYKVGRPIKGTTFAPQKIYRNSTRTVWKPSVTKACKFSLLISLRHDRCTRTRPAIRPFVPRRPSRACEWHYRFRPGVARLARLGRIAPRAARSVPPRRRVYSYARSPAFVSRPANERVSRRSRTHDAYTAICRPCSVRRHRQCRCMPSSRASMHAQIILCNAHLRVVNDIVVILYSRLRSFVTVTFSKHYVPRFNRIFLDTFLQYYYCYCRKYYNFKPLGKMILLHIF